METSQLPTEISPTVPDPSVSETPFQAEIARLMRENAQLRTLAPTAQQPQVVSETRVRSMARTWTGVAMLAVGGIIAIDGARFQSACSKLNPYATQANTLLTDIGYGEFAGTCNGWARISIGGGLAGVGALLATTLSDVPVARDLDVIFSPGRFEVRRTFGF